MTIDPIAAPVLVTGATGNQGGATARALLAAGVSVRALVRDPAGERAKTVEGLGAELVAGDLRDRDSVHRATEGTRAVFSVQLPAADAPDSEWIQASNLIDAARVAGVAQFVHSSVAGVGRHRDAPGWAEGRWAHMDHFFETKATIQDRVREAGFTYWTLLKPGFFMENFAPHHFLMPHGPERGLATIIRPDTELPLVAVDDIGAAAAAAVADPARFHRVELDLASERITMRRIAEVLSGASGIELTAPDMTDEEALAAGMPPMGLGHRWTDEVDQPGDPADARALGIAVTSFADWAKSNLGPDPARR